MTSSTITGNSSGAGGGVYGSGVATLLDTLIAGNSDASGQPDTSIAATGSNNLIGDGSGLGGITNGTNGNQVGTGANPIDPKLDPAGLLTNGSTGPKTLALLRNSPAIEAGGTCPVGVLTDARGKPRLGACDIGAYEYQPVAPTVTDTTAPATGGGVTFTGTGFQTGTQLTLAGATLTALASAVSADGTHVTLTVPPHAVGAVPFAVTNPGASNPAVGTLTYVPVIARLGPASGTGAGGVTVTITGSGFGTDIAQVSVQFGPAVVTVTGVSDTQLTVTTPPGSGTVDVTVTVRGQSATKAGAYTYGTVLPAPAPHMSTATPQSATPLPATHPAAATSVSAVSPQPVRHP